MRRGPTGNKQRVIEEEEAEVSGLFIEPVRVESSQVCTLLNN